MSGEKVLVITPERCISCDSCELACSFANEGEFKPSASRIHVLKFEAGISVPMTCFQCEKPACVAACKTGALYRDGQGVVQVNADKCIGCRMCVMACPFGNINYRISAKSPDKCTLCDGDPQCAAFCPTGAIEYLPADTAVLRKKKEFSQKIAEAVGEVKV